jgi:hypothetical protein
MTETHEVTWTASGAGAGAVLATDEAAVWAAFEVRLAVSLAALPERAYLILEHDLPESDDGSHFVQFARERAGLLAEAVSNLYLEGGRRLDPGQEATLAELGWEAPHPRSKHRRNWSRRWRTPTPDAEAAALAVRSLREAYRVASPSDLKEVRFARSGEDLPDPVLGLPQVDAFERTVRAWGPKRVDRVVEVALAVLVGPDGIERPAPGRWDLLLDSVGIRVERLDARPRAVRAYAVFLGGVAPGPELFELLNAVNARLLTGRVLWVDGALIVADEVRAPGLTADGLVLACMELVRSAGRLTGEFGAGMRPFAGDADPSTRTN